MNKVNEKDAKAFDNPYKVAFIAMLDSDKNIHITLLSTLMNKGKEMMFGEFVVGNSKKYIYENPDTAFLIMSLDMKVWTGNMHFTRNATEGEDYIHYNNMPLYRYNSYFGINKVHYADLIDISEAKPLKLVGSIMNKIAVGAKKHSLYNDNASPALRPWVEKMMKKIDTLSFIAFMGKDGFLKMVPAIQAESVSSSRIVLKQKPYKEELKDLKEGDKISLYALRLDMSGVLVKGIYHKAKGDFGYIDIETVYNPLPPKPGVIYPLQPNEAVIFNS